MWLFRMALCAVVLTTSVLWGNSGVPRERVTLWLELPNGFAPLTVQQLEAELSAIVEPAGLQLGWRRLPASAGAVVDGASIVVRFRGACAPSLSSGTRRSVAGWAHTSDGAILPFIEVDCDQVWSAIETRLENEAKVHQEVHLGRALGRVVAHELYHVLANSSTHGTTGLTKARLDSRDLITGQYSLAHEDLTPRVRIGDAASTVASGRPGLPSHPGRQTLRARSAHNPEEASDIGR
jgi:hypothetical protein